MPTRFTPSRRSLLGTAALSTLITPFMGVSTAMSATQQHQSMRAVHHFHVGALRVTVIDDARFTFPAPAFAVNQAEGSAGRFLSKYGLPTETVSLHMQVTLVERGSQKILLDTGMGDVTFPGNDPDNGRLLASLSGIGVSPGDITDVILSHGHPDHIGSCSANGKPVFENATYYMSPDELEFWTQKPGTEETFPNLMLAVGNAQLSPIRSRVKPYRSGDEIVPGITAIAARGHTLGHHAFMLHDGGARLLHLMDTAVHYLVGPEEPDWALGVEMDQTAAAITRRRLFKQAAEETVLVAGYHFPFPGIGKIIADGSAWRFVPVQTA